MKVCCWTFEGSESEMCALAELPEQEDFTVFDGSSPEDVSHARQLWSSLSLLPPLESRLVSADIRQRLPVSRPHCSSSAAGPRHPAPQTVPDLRQRREERQRFAAMAEQRREILALLSRQRDQRVQKELLSVHFKAKLKLGEKVVQEPPDSDMELVKQLQ
ncbi:cilia- and flagella-associated protein HOATZ [Cottoperca gobio]|uniref:Cilia- and flagella-associated protein HOATZ n=1 Tax=Cottoperca gobio TaxID=56716 RepID=A0A6J2QA06_COTGO|nr:UPF0722 protein C11orf88 homolog [Cottoperca gobio]